MTDFRSSPTISPHARQERGRDCGVRAAGDRLPSADHCRARHERQPASGSLTSPPARGAGTELGAAIHRSGVHHESYFFASADERVYASLYHDPAVPVRVGMVICLSWGIEAPVNTEWLHRIAHDAARLGIPTVVPHWPGTQDSEGDPHAATFDRLVTTAIHATLDATERAGTREWFPLGVRVGAAVAALAAGPLEARHLLLVQPELDPARFFREYERAARRSALGSPVPEGWAYAHPNPPGLRDPADTERIERALAAYTGDGAVVRYRRPTGAPVPPLRTITTWGDWRTPPRVDHTPLRLAVMKWLRRTAGRTP